MDDSTPVPAVAIRDAEPHELDEVGRVILASYQEYAERMPPEAWAEYAQNMQNVASRLPESELIVAVQRGKIVGSATFYPLHRRADSVWPSDWTGVRLVAVEPYSRGQGIGRMLVAECVRRSREQGAAAVGLHTTPLMTVAAAMYERMGFVRVPEFDHSDPDMTVMAYTLALS